MFCIFFVSILVFRIFFVSGICYKMCCHVARIFSVSEIRRLVGAVLVFIFSYRFSYFKFKFFGGLYFFHTFVFISYFIRIGFYIFVSFLYLFCIFVFCRIVFRVS